jgi:hypothetical protein
MHRVSPVATVQSRLIASIGVLLVLTLTALPACNGGGGSKATPPPSGDPPTRVPIKVPGTEPVVLVLNAALAGDTIELARLTGYAEVACKKDVAGSGGPPACRDNESDGQAVMVLARLDCEGGWVRPEQVSDAYRAALNGPAKLLALFVPKPNPSAYGGNLGVQYVMVMQTGTRSDGTADGFALHIRDGRVLMLQTPCTGLLQLIDPATVSSYIVAPGSSAVATP